MAISRTTKMPEYTSEIFEELKQCAASRISITYGDLAGRFGPRDDPRWVIPALNHIRDHVCLPHNHPWLWMLAVRKEEGWPGPGAADGTGLELKGKQHWRELVEPVYDYDWSQVKIDDG